MLTPFLGLTDYPHHPCDRYTYLSCLGWAFLMGLVVTALWWGWRGPGRFRLASVALVAVTLFACAGWGIGARRQVRVWSDSIALFDHMLALEQDRFMRSVILYRLGSTWQREGQLDRAVEALSESNRLAMEHVADLEIRQASLTDEGKHDRAAECHRRLVAARAVAPQAAVRLASIFIERKQVGEATALMREVVRRCPAQLDARFELGRALLAGNRLEASGAEFRAVLRRQPEHAAALANLAMVHAGMGRREAALATARRALELAEAQGTAKLQVKVRAFLAELESGELGADEGPAARQPPPDSPPDA
jgi:tetratricopeptide (TPR) repeat protein